MPIELIVMLIASLVCVAAMRMLPKAHGPDVVAAVSLVVLALLSWVSAVWLVCGCALTLAAMAMGARMARKTAAFVCGVGLHLGALVVLREQPALVLLGGAYFTLRHIHVLADWWTDTVPRPGTREYLRYQAFLPVLAAGPIHRFGNFQRQMLRRRNDPAELALGAERLLIGAFQFTVLGGWLMTRVAVMPGALMPGLGAVPLELAGAALDWVELYLVFAGLSSMAIGLALMMGLQIEENFRQPWRATDLPDFWSRWHVSLTDFSKDYVFRPISARFGSGMLGALAAMLFIGLWHGTSVQWGLWGLWQGLGILLTLRARRLGVFARWPVWMGRVFAGCWLVAAHPVASRIAEVLP